MHAGETSAELLGGPSSLQMQSWDGLLQPFPLTGCSRQYGAQMRECVGGMALLEEGAQDSHCQYLQRKRNKAFPTGTGQHGAVPEKGLDGLEAWTR